MSDSRSPSVAVEPSGSPTLILRHASVMINAGIGLSIQGGAFEMSQSTIFGNAKGGLEIEGAVNFAVVNNVFASNGNTSSVIGAVSISAVESPSNRLDFNTFYQNSAQTGIGSAIDCIAGVFTVRDNILDGAAGMTNAGALGACAHAHALVPAGSTLPGTDNRSGDPLFVDADNRDFHVMPESPAYQADPVAALEGLAQTDSDGMPRTVPATLGAYQLPGSTAAP